MEHESGKTIILIRELAKVLTPYDIVVNGIVIWQKKTKLYKKTWFIYQISEV